MEILAIVLVGIGTILTLMGVAWKGATKLTRIETKQEQINGTLEGMKDCGPRMAAMEKTAERHNKRLGRIDKRLGKVEDSMDKIWKKVNHD